MLIDKSPQFGVIGHSTLDMIHIATHSDCCVSINILSCNSFLFKKRPSKWNVYMYTYSIFVGILKCVMIKADNSFYIYLCKVLKEVDVKIHFMLTYFPDLVDIEALL